MNKLKTFRTCVGVISTGIFLYQFKIALENLMDPPMMHMIQYKNISDITMPLIMICPLGQINDTRFKEFGYPEGYYVSYMGGNAGNVTSWGSHLNLTYQEFMKQVLEPAPLESVAFSSLPPEVLLHGYNLLTPIDIELEQKLFPKYGYCLQASDYDPFLSNFIEVNGDYDVDIFFTDKELLTYNTFDITSHKGPRITIKGNDYAKYEISVEQRSWHDPKKRRNCKDYRITSYADCVDKVVQDVIAPAIGCNPPWLSPTNQCTTLGEEGTPQFATMYKILSLTDVLRRRILFLDKLPKQNVCIQPCLQTKTNVNLMYRDADEDGLRIVELTFDKRVVFDQKVIMYNFFDFLIDVGSSLGLWLGLSVYGLVDLGIEVGMIVKNIAQKLCLPRS